MAVPPEVEALIADAPLSAHLATAADDRPHVAPVWYGYRDGALYFMTGGRKLSNLRRNPRVALSIEQLSDDGVDWNVTLLGRATVHDDSDKKEWASGWIYDKYDAEESDTDDADSIQESDTATNESRTGQEHESGASDDGEAYDSALIEVTIGSVSWNVY